MKKKVLVVALAAAVMLFGAACGKQAAKSSSGSSSSSQSTVQSQDDEDDDADDQDDQDDDDDDNEIGDDAADADDPSAGQPEMENNSDESDAEVKAEYVGTWVMKGLLMKDGSIDTSSNISGKYVISSDGTYSSTLTNPDGGKSNASGKWKLTKSKNLSADSTLTLSDDGDYLLKYSGERDGKGFKLYYAYAKSR